MKPGYKTTEFWVTALVIVISGAVALGVFNSAEAEAVKSTIPTLAAAIAAAVYAVSRAWSKSHE